MGVLPSFTGSCSLANITMSHNSNQKQKSISTVLHPNDKRGIFNFYSTSYLYFGAMASSTVVLVGLVVSYATGPTKRSQIKEGLLWWDLSKQKEEIPSQHRDRMPEKPQVIPLMNMNKEEVL
uniref:Solute carrier family 5 (Sodium iodide symporter), member 5 n=1 Tax=Nothobranchius korthausae TaxID=1143690 RepID=A0A1A8FUE4_9TELE